MTCKYHHTALVPFAYVAHGAVSGRCGAQVKSVRSRGRTELTASNSEELGPKWSEFDVVWSFAYVAHGAVSDGVRLKSKVSAVDVARS